MNAFIVKKAQRLVSEVVAAEKAWAEVDSRVWPEASDELEWEAQKLFAAYDAKTEELTEYLVKNFDYSRRGARTLVVFNIGKLERLLKEQST